MVTKAELLKTIKELEHREILLEYTVNKFHELIEIFSNHPVSKMIVSDEAFGIAYHLFNVAEVRSNIEQLVNFEVEYEEEEE